MSRPLSIFLVSLLAVPLRAGEPGLKQTIEYVQKLQTNTGGFLSMAPQPNIRLAPTFPPLEDVTAAMEAVTTCVLLASAEQLTESG